MVIDKPVVVTGSFNFTKAAEHHNAETLFVIRSNESDNGVQREREEADEACGKLREEAGTPRGTLVKSYPKRFAIV
jgi:phosphatidylserine/phosphatidylglycerophosphate/cardiolipin synthase-like enzyme